MSSIYIQEPPTAGKVLLKTTVGDIDVELWSKECPRACRNFLQLCIDGYYNNTLFDRVVKGFIVQGGNGNANELLSNEPLKEEFHSRLRFIRRGLVGMVNSEECDNSSQFFFTMAATPELQNQNTLFGKVTGDTLFNMLNLEEGLVDHNERPCYPQKILKVQILNNPFDDMEPRYLKATTEVKPAKRQKEAGVKNFGLLSFGEEAQEDEEETEMFVQKISAKGKSMHDVNEPPVKSSEEISEESSTSKILEKVIEIKTKLEKKGIESEPPKSKTMKVDHGSDSEEDYLKIEEEEKKKANEVKKKGIQSEIQALKKQYQKDKKTKDVKPDEKTSSKKSKKDNHKDLMEIQEKYKVCKKKNDGQSRDELTLSLLSKFRKQLETAKEKSKLLALDTREYLDVDEEIENSNWLSHSLCFDDIAPIVAKDASTKSSDWYDHDSTLRRQKRREACPYHSRKRNFK